MIHLHTRHTRCYVPNQFRTPVLKPVPHLRLLLSTPLKNLDDTPSLSPFSAPNTTIHTQNLPPSYQLLKAEPSPLPQLPLQSP